MRLLIVSLGALFCAAQSRADFVGQEVALSEDGRGTFFDVVVSNVPYSYVNPLTDPALLSINATLSGDNLTISVAPPAFVLSGGIPQLILSDLTDSAQIITGVTVDPATSVMGFDASHVSFDSEDVYVNLIGLRMDLGQEVSLDFTFAGNPTPIVPEPRMVWLLVVACGLALLVRRQKSRPSKNTV
jgi:hypothetical protein